MADTLSIRLEDRDRDVLERAAKLQGTGLSAFIRELAHGEARRIRREEIRAEGDRIVAYLKAHPEAAAEIEEYGTPDESLP